MSSAHVGSMGGIMALRRGEAHAAGCHLLDTNNGEYNKSFIKKDFPKGGVKLLEMGGYTLDNPGEIIEMAQAPEL